MSGALAGEIGLVLRKSESKSRTLRLPGSRRRLKRSESSDQLYLDFGDDDERPLQFAHSTETVEQYFADACAAEQEARLQDAVTAYRRGLQIGGSNAVLCFNLANVLFVLGEFAEAVEHFQKAVGLRPAFAEAWNNLGVVLVESDKTERALVALQRAVTLEPDRAEAQYNLADLLDELGQSAAAAKHWRAYLRLDADSDWAAHARSRLLSSPSDADE